MKPMICLGWFENQRLIGCVVLTGCLLSPLFFLSAIGPNWRSSVSTPVVAVNFLRVPFQPADEPALLVDGRNNSQPQGKVQLSIQHANEPKVLIEGREDSEPQGRTIEESKVICDRSHYRTDVCEMSAGDIRVNGTSYSIILVEPPLPWPRATNETIGNTTWKIRPYARKWEGPTLARIKEFTLRKSSAMGSQETPPSCTTHHSVPAIVFSTGGFQGNYFHEFTDVLVPLYLTSNQYKGEVQFLVSEFKPDWVKKYQAVLRQLSRYEIINLDADENVHCFRQVTVGLRSHNELGIDPLQHPKGNSMIDFRKFLRASFSLKKERAGSKNKKPRLLIVSRKRSRSIKNENKLVRMAHKLGYKVIVAGPEATADLARFAYIVNSCDVLMGVHGAGLTNMVFLPNNATVIQVVPWGDISVGCRFLLGEPALGMGLRYLEYEIGMEESSLTERYPRNHEIFTDPTSVHKRGFDAIWDIFLNQQNVTINLGRFRPVLKEALKASSK